MNLLEEKKLICQAQKNTQAFSKLYDYYFPKIYLYCINRLPNSTIAQDITSEVFLASIKSINSFESKSNISFSSWLYRVAHNKIVDYFRQNKKLTSFEYFENQLVNDEDIDQNIVHDEIQTQVTFILSKLKKRYQEVLSYRYYTQMDNDEIATILKLKTQNVALILHRALKSFKKLYEKYFPNSEIFNMF